MTHTENYVSYLELRIDAMAKRIDKLEAIIEIEILNKDQ
tara:strand:+ start:354 stop:470 length:117 start_codon:yes stop_codon:yes gene_type:complete